jgi:hypothetical protein
VFEKLTHGLPWRHPAVLLIFLMIIVIGVDLYVESHVPIGTRGASRHRGGFYDSLALIGSFVWGWILLHIIALPEEYLPKPSLTLDVEVYKRREGFIRGVGYFLGIVTVVFSIYKIASLSPLCCH